MKADGVQGGEDIYYETMLRMFKGEATRHEVGSAIYGMAMYQVAELQGKIDRRSEVTRSLGKQEEHNPNTGVQGKNEGNPPEGFGSPGEGGKRVRPGEKGP